MPYYHVVFTLPAAIADIAYQNKAIGYYLLFKASARDLGVAAAARDTTSPVIGFSRSKKAPSEASWPQGIGNLPDHFNLEQSVVEDAFLIWT